MDVQSIMAAHGGGEGEVVSEESALFEYSRSITRTRAVQRLCGCRRRPERLPPLGREQYADQEEKRKMREDLSEFYHLRDLRDELYRRKSGCELLLLWRFTLLISIENEMERDHSTVKIRK